ncbi:MAG: acyloxyacyl hydrolase [bacterium]
MKKLYFSVIFISMVNCIFCQTEKSFSMEYNTGNVFAHNKDVENVGGSTTNGVELKYTFKKLDSLYYSSFNGFPSQGFAIGFTNFNNTILGKGITANYFISPNITINNWLSTAFNFNLGAAYLTNPNREFTNPENQSYSTYISAYLAIGWETKIAITKRINLNLGASYRHTSNAGVKLPNKGINWTTANFGLTYNTSDPVNTKKLKNRFNAYKFTHKNFWELSVFGAIRNLNNESATKYGIAGFQLQHNWQTAKTHAFNVGTEFFIDNSLAKQIKIENNKSSIGLRQGILVGHQFLWGKVNFGQQIGFHLINPENKYTTMYHRWTITHKITSHFSAGVSLLAHGHVANFADLRVVYRL